ncbi:hypothetical protein LEA_15775, partial [human gut metagenome]
MEPVILVLTRWWNFKNAGYEVVIIDNLSNSSADVVDNIEKVSG